ncbi:MAG: hypothetical protein AB1705_17535, partial [Verrucomicrobiota bacterium]
FLSMSYELVSPRILLCPQDKARFKDFAQDFSTTNSLGYAHPAKRDLATSYFVNLSADEVNPQSLLVGDRNIGPNARAPAYSSAVQGAIQIGINSAWSMHPSNLLHTNVGHYALSDGGVQQVDTKKLQNQLKQAADAYGTNANWFLFPQ